MLRLSSGKTRFNCLGLCDLINVGKNIALCLELLWVLCIILTTILGSAVKILRQQENPLIIFCSCRFFSLNKKVRAIKYSFNFSWAKFFQTWIKHEVNVYKINVQIKYSKVRDFHLWLWQLCGALSCELRLWWNVACLSAPHCLS